jgi:hypothetical protein
MKMEKGSKMRQGAGHVSKNYRMKGISMARYRTYGWGLGLAVGLVVGLVLGGLWPQAPIHASATDRVENFAIATGFVDPETEAVFYLDYLTGNLNAAVLSRMSFAFQSHFTTNVHADLQRVISVTGGGVQMPQSPNYLMVTGTVKIPTKGNPTIGNTAVYVAETNTGIVMAYVIPWQREFFNADKPYKAQLILRAGEQFSAAMLRPE